MKEIIIKIMFTLFKILLFIVLGFVGGVILYLTYQYVPKSYMAESIEGVVLDKVTGRPVVGAIVVVSWYSQSPDFHSPRREIFEVQESVTDASGRYFIPGWKYKKLHRTFGSFAGEQPIILVYKDGYLPEHFSNKILLPGDHDPGRLHPSAIRWYHSTVLTLNVLSGDENQDAERFRNIIYYSPPFRDGCIWKKSPNLILELDKQYERDELKQKAIYERDIKFTEFVLQQQSQAWYLTDWYKARISGCPEIIELLSSARKLRSQN